MRTNYSFSVLRYVYDPVSQEFVNVGVVGYSRDTRQLYARCAQNYGRISKFFGSFDGVRLRQTLRFIQDRLNDIASAMTSELEFRPTRSLGDILNSVLPLDDSSLRFIDAGVGLTDDLTAEVEGLFVRYVERYSGDLGPAKRADEDVWKSFRGCFDRNEITPRLQPKRIVARNYEYDFNHSWKNGIWQLLEPVSFDLQNNQAIAEKANRWVGRAVGLEDSQDEFKLYLLLGKPSDERLTAAYRKAENLLHKMPIRHELIEETEAAEFARELAAKMHSAVS